MEILHHSQNRTRRTGTHNPFFAVILTSALTIVCCLFVCVSVVFADEISISDAVKKFVESNKRVRIAVFDFANTGGTKTRFDTFIADTIVT